MITFRCGKFVGVLALLLVGGQMASARYWLGPKSALLRYRLKEGDKLRCTIERKSVAGIQLGTTKERITTTHQVLDVLQTIGEVRDGVARVSFKIERLRFTMEREGTAGSAVKFDSRTARLADGRNVEGIEITANLDARGQLSDIQVPVNLLNGLRGIAKAVDVTLVETWQMMLMQSFPVLPAEPVTKGRTWAHQIVSPRKTAVWRVDSQYAYQGAESMTPATGREKLALTPLLTIEMKKGALANADTKAKHEGDGIAYFDNQTGRLVEMNLTQNLEQSLQLDLKGAKRDVRQRMRQSLSVKVVDAR